jgi:hypothetical protein
VIKLGAEDFLDLFQINPQTAKPTQSVPPAIQRKCSRLRPGGCAAREGGALFSGDVDSLFGEEAEASRLVAGFLGSGLLGDAVEFVLAGFTDRLESVAAIVFVAEMA